MCPLSTEHSWAFGIAYRTNCHKSCDGSNGFDDETSDVQKTNCDYEMVFANFSQALTNLS